MQFCILFLFFVYKFYFLLIFFSIAASCVLISYIIFRVKLIFPPIGEQAVDLLFYVVELRIAEAEHILVLQ